ncbi:hypothetical protein DSECCO2_475380 [anaerobic digester metagenome]
MICFRDNGCKPVFPEQLLLAVAEQLATAAVDEPDGMIGVDDDEEAARHVEVVPDEIPLFLHLPFPPLELPGEGGDDESDEDEHQGAPIIVQCQDIRPVEEAAHNDEPAEEESDQHAPLLPPECGQDDRDVEEMREDGPEHEDGMEVVGQEDRYGKKGDEDTHSLLFGKGNHGGSTLTTDIYNFKI